MDNNRFADSVAQFLRLSPFLSQHMIYPIFLEMTGLWNSVGQSRRQSSLRSAFDLDLNNANHLLVSQTFSNGSPNSGLIPLISRLFTDSPIHCNMIEL
jgi:hypothetical protein